MTNITKIQTINNIIKEPEYLRYIIFNYNSIDNNIIKINLRNSISYKAREYGRLQGIAEYIKMDLNTLKSQLYTTHTAKVTLENLLWICGALDIPLTDIFQTNNNVDIVSGSRFWTEDKKQEFILYYKDKGLAEAMKKYSLTEKTARQYYQVFRHQ